MTEQLITPEHPLSEKKSSAIWNPLRLITESRNHDRLPSVSPKQYRVCGALSALDSQSDARAQTQFNLTAAQVAEKGMGESCRTNFHTRLMVGGAAKSALRLRPRERPRPKLLNGFGLTLIATV